MGAFVLAVLPNPPQLPGSPSDKIQHVAAFAVLSGLAFAAFPGASSLRRLVWLSGFGALIEVVQAITLLHRDSDIHDWIADTAACVIVLAACEMGRWWWTKRR